MMLWQEHVEIWAAYWNLAAQLDSQPSPALAAHLYDK